ncbi:MAG TPA: hypothetical protein VKB71_10455 [Rhizomicrobium sp.]|nr:hypothetical protein [Rhizomicrobium sp.]
MRLPGFAAEAALAETENRYHQRWRPPQRGGRSLLAWFGSDCVSHWHWARIGDSERFLGPWTSCTSRTTCPGNCKCFDFWNGRAATECVGWQTCWCT